MTSVIIIVVLNLAFAGWVGWLVARDPGNVFKRRPPSSGSDNNHSSDDSGT